MDVNVTVTENQINKCNTHCGYVAVVGRPNVGKSTLINYIIGYKLNITSRKPQTTRHQVLAIHSKENIQTIFVDTPGLHQNTPSAMNRYMNRAARNALLDVDVIIFMVDSGQWHEEDDWIVSQFKPLNVPVILLINKMDQLADKKTLLPYIDQAAKKYEFAAIIPCSVLKRSNIPQVEQEVKKYLPQRAFEYPDDQMSNQSERFFAAELIREKLMRRLGHELPYQVTVSIERFQRSDNVLHIDALILVERESQKAIVIGKNGMKMKQMGSEARVDLEKLFQIKTMLKVWVKVKNGWSDDERMLRELGYQH